MISDYELNKRMYLLEEQRDKLEKRLFKLGKKIDQLNELQNAIEKRLENLYVIEDHRGGQDSLYARLDGGNGDAK
jgi:hypothetical protein